MSAQSPAEQPWELWYWPGACRGGQGRALRRRRYCLRLRPVFNRGVVSHQRPPTSRCVLYVGDGGDGGD